MQVRLPPALISQSTPFRCPFQLSYSFGFPADECFQAPPTHCTSGFGRVSLVLPGSAASGTIFMYFCPVSSGRPKISWSGARMLQLPCLGSFRSVWASFFRGLRMSRILANDRSSPTLGTRLSGLSFSPPAWPGLAGTLGFQLACARFGVGLVSPNPLLTAVIFRSGHRSRAPMTLSSARLGS